MIKSYNVIVKLIDRYDYGGALQVLNERGLDDSDVAVIVKSCKYAVNFDFKTAFKIIQNISDECKENRRIKELINNLKHLIKGEPDAIFSELIENIKFQLVNEEYIDFLGRIYRFKEAIFKYIFIKKHLNRRNFSLYIDAMSKKRILKILRKKYRINNSNLVYGITTYINRYHDSEERYNKIIRLLNSEKVTKLIDLRNDTIVGHGFKGVSKEDLSIVYGNPYNVLDDFKYCLKLLDIKINEYKYSKINDQIKKMLDKINNS
ncbi:hypothetical protein [Caminicella sporogenes]|uniref:hypothetical protein n=1 Tax=Caminicella sporogenes TaxID=166485 RepID=UPI002541A9C8|nr:hypothetical protein [Caminicella sporogenes]WIF94987.1 hypothetical protein QNI18_12115 [Caminicella sporogenes]